MKNYIPTSLLIFFCTSVFAHTEKGKFALSGKSDLNFLFSNTAIFTDSVEIGKMKSNQYGFTAGFGYFIMDNLNVGFSGTYSYNYTKTNGGTYPSFSGENITKSFTILPQINYYYPLEGKLKPSVVVGAGYVWMQERDSKVTDNNNEVYSFSGPSFAGGAGLSYFISRSVSFDLGLQYSYNKLKNKLNTIQTYNVNAFAGRLGITVFF